VILQSSILDSNPMSLQSGLQFLNPIDRTLQCFDGIARQLGYPGIETQMLVWLEGRADAAALHTAITRLSKQYPVVASRLVVAGDNGAGRPYWRFRPGDVCCLTENILTSDDPQAVLEYAGDVLSNGRDPAAADPLEFHFLHRPGGKDVVLFQYNHVLMDNRMAVPLLNELERLSKSPARPYLPAIRANYVSDYLREIPRDKRHAMIQSAIRLQAHDFRGRVANLVPMPAPQAGRARLKIVSRSLNAEQASLLRAKIVSLCGFPCLSMAILASAFRTIRLLGPHDDVRENFAAGIGIPVNRRNRAPLAFQNLTSAITIRASRKDLDDRDRLIRMLSDQLRQRLADGIDAGTLGTIAIFSRRFRYIEWAAWHLVRYCYSLWYAFFGNLQARGSTFCGSRIEDIFHTGGPIWPSIGLALLVNQSCGRLNFQATYDSNLISLQLAQTFLDFILADLFANSGSINFR
jgi:hypothetical protein